MHGVRPRGKPRRRVSPAAEEEAIKTATYFLGRFIAEVASWDEQGTDVGSPKRELRHAIGLIECGLDDEAANDIPGIEIARKVAIPILRRARPPAASKSGSLSFSWRNQIIIEAIKAVCARHNLKPTRNPQSRDEEHDPSGCSVVMEALRRAGNQLSEKRITDEIWGKRTPDEFNGGV
jgi:hypothetical protein